MKVKLGPLVLIYIVTYRITYNYNTSINDAQIHKTGQSTNTVSSKHNGPT